MRFSPSFKYPEDKLFEGQCWDILAAVNAAIKPGDTCIYVKKLIWRKPYVPFRRCISFINPLVTIKFFSSFFYWKVKKKIHVGVKKANLKFYLDIFVYHEDIRV